jgi:hypothetical protein
MINTSQNEGIMRKLGSMLIVCLIVGLASGCTWFKKQSTTPTGQTLITNESQCVGDALIGEMNSIENAVIAILVSNASNKQDQLDALASASKKNGENAVICAVFAAITAFASHPPTAAPTVLPPLVKMQVSPDQAKQDAISYLKGKGVEVKQ